MITLALGSDSITLRDPDFDNAERLEISRISRKSRGGDQIVYRDPAWPITQILDMKFSFLSELQSQRLLNFLDLSLGQSITLVDHEGRTWTGVVTSPSGELSQPGRQNRTAHIVFQGVRS